MIGSITFILVGLVCVVVAVWMLARAFRTGAMRSRYTGPDVPRQKNPGFFLGQRAAAVAARLGGVPLILVGIWRLATGVTS